MHFKATLWASSVNETECTAEAEAEGAGEFGPATQQTCAERAEWRYEATKE